MKIIIFFLFLSFSQGLIAQKKLITNKSREDWAKLGRYDITDDGKYVLYEQNPYDSSSKLVFCSINGKQRTVINGARNGRFTAGGRYLIFSRINGTIGFLETCNSKIHTINRAGSYQIPTSQSSFWFTYQIGDTLILTNFSNNAKQYFDSANNSSWFNKQGTVLLVRSGDRLLWIDLIKGGQLEIFRGESDRNYAFDESGTRIVFTARSGGEPAIFYFQAGMKSAIKKIDNNSYGIKEGYVISQGDLLRFGSDGSQIFFELEKRSKNSRDSIVITSNVDVWSFKDAFTIPEQNSRLNDFSLTHFQAMAALNGKALCVIQLETEKFSLVHQPQNKIAILRDEYNISEAFWNESQKFCYYLMDLRTGKRRPIITDLDYESGNISISQNEDFIVWYDYRDNSFKCYDIINGSTILLSKDVPTSFAGQWPNRNQRAPFSTPFWTKDDKKVLIADEYDIWELDPQGKEAPINLTNGYGRKTKVRFRIGVYPEVVNKLKADDHLLLAALDMNTYDNGFVTVNLGRANTPRLSLQNCLFYFPNMPSGISPVVKAKNASVYIVVRQSSTEAPNLVATINGKKFVSLSNIEPQKEYNWMTSKLIKWKMPDGEEGRGILYKPENFDSTKKYPLILHYYEMRTHELNLFRNPEVSGGVIDIPWYVSNGYLVFIPDIPRKSGKLVEGICNAVISAAKYLCTLNFVKKESIGLQGQSFGGYETNLLISKSKLFAAAQSSAGMSDLVSDYGDMRYGGKHLATYYEFTQPMMKDAVWNDLKSYIDASPALNANYIVTPLLLQNNKNDENMYRQGIELFTALRRLKKSVWLLQYDNEGHYMGGNSALDFSIRQQQFFNHYLKGAPPPKWMTTSILAKDKGIVSGLELDLYDKCSNICSICNSSRAKNPKNTKD